MPTRSYHVSDLSGAIIEQEGDVVTIIVHEHPLLSDPVQLYVSTTEADTLDAEELDCVVLEVVTGDGRKQVLLERPAFDKLFSTLPVDDVLKSADPYRGKRAGRQRARDWADYTQPNTFGLVHKGLPSAKEKELVQAHLDQANANRRR